MSDKFQQYSELDIDIEKGMLMGDGINMRHSENGIQKVFIPWSNLNSHFMCFGTTRQGKTRLMVFMMRQIIEKKEHLIVIEPKGAEEQEVLSWIIQYANEFDSLSDIMYWSPEHPDMSVRMNMLYGQKDEEATATVLSAMKVEDEFYEDIANEILMAILPAFSFLEELMDPLVIEIMERKEYAKAKIENPINAINKYIKGSKFSTSEDGAEVNILQTLIDSVDGNIEKIKKIEKAYKEVMQRYSSNASGLIPIRRFVTFEDLAYYTSQDKMADLYEIVKKEIASAKSKNLSSDIIANGMRAERELKKLKDRDSGYFSKVSTSYAVTMTRLSTGNVGRLLCESKINVFRDEFYKKDSRVILIVQPFPMKYSKAANMSVKMLMSMMNNIMATVGVSGVSNYKRTHVMVDEAGSITNQQILSLANKGGGLGLSLYLYSQSFADYKDILGEDGSTILADNSNNKAFFLVNDEKSAETISTIIGGKKKGDMSYGANEGTTLRNQGKLVDEAFVPPHLIMQLEPMTFAMKSGKDIFMMSAPYQRDPYLEVFFNTENNRGRASKYADIVETYKDLEQY